VRGWHSEYQRSPVASVTKTPLSTTSRRMPDYPKTRADAAPKPRPDGRSRFPGSPTLGAALYPSAPTPQDGRGDQVAQAEDIKGDRQDQARVSPCESPRRWLMSVRRSRSSPPRGLRSRRAASRRQRHRGAPSTSHGREPTRSRPAPGSEKEPGYRGLFRRDRGSCAAPMGQARVLDVVRLVPADDAQSCANDGEKAEGKRSRPSPSRLDPVLSPDMTRRCFYAERRGLNRGTGRPIAVASSARGDTREALP
jgi:hypothetical protein